MPIAKNRTRRPRSSFKVDLPYITSMQWINWHETSTEQNSSILSPVNIWLLQWLVYDMKPGKTVVNQRIFNEHMNEWTKLSTSQRDSQVWSAKKQLAGDMDKAFWKDLNVDYSTVEEWLQHQGPPTSLVFFHF